MPSGCSLEVLFLSLTAMNAMCARVLMRRRHEETACLFCCIQFDHMTPHMHMTTHMIFLGVTVAPETEVFLN
jgi:hypothetical protein